MKRILLFALSLIFLLNYELHATEQTSPIDEISLKRDELDKWWQHSSIYHIWVRSFFDTDGDSNGDINGIRQKLPYLQSLGINTVLLSPIFQSSSYHGYDVVDHYEIDPTLGSKQDLKMLIEEAHKVDIRVLLDLPINHTSHLHPWFQKSLEQKGKYKDFYRWRQDLPDDYGFPWDEESPVTSTWHHKEQRAGFYYGLFGYDNPDLNYQNKEVQKEAFKIAKYWVEFGVDGFRIDAARHLVEEGPNPLQADTESNRTFIKALVRKIKKINTNVLVLGEALTDLQSSKSYLKGKNSMDALFNFEFRDELAALYLTNEYFNSDDDDTATKSVKDIYERLTKHKQTNKEYIVFLNNHDFSRFVTESPSVNTIKKIMGTLSILSPFSHAIYYGDELATTQKEFDDNIFARAPMIWNEKKNGGFTTNDISWVDDKSWVLWRPQHQPWFDDFSRLHYELSVEAQEQDENSVLKHYQKLLKIKNNDKVLSSPRKFKVINSGNPQILAVKYSSKGSKRLVLVNLNPNKVKEAKLKKKIMNRFQIKENELRLEAGDFMVFTAEQDVDGAING